MGSERSDPYKCMPDKSNNPGSPLSFPGTSSVASLQVVTVCRWCWGSVWLQAACDHFFSSGESVILDPDI